MYVSYNCMLHVHVKYLFTFQSKKNAFASQSSQDELSEGSN